MPTTVLDPTPAWLKRENASVFDSYWKRIARGLGQLVGADDPTSQVMGVATAMEAPAGKALTGLKALATGDKAAALDLSHAARMERATAQGYGPVMHHETEAANVPGLVREGFDLNRVGARGSDEVMPNGVFLKPTAKAINVAREPSQLTLRHRAQNLLEFQTRAELEHFLLRDAQYAEQHAALKANERKFAAEFDALDAIAWRSDAPEAKAARARLDSVLDEWGKTNREIAARARERATDLLRASGAEGIHVKHDPGSAGRTVDTTVIFNPAHVRDQWAAFDPSRLSSKDLAASIVGGVALSQVAKPKKEPTR